MIDRFLSKTGVGIALLFMIGELGYINTKSLQYMLGANGYEAVFGIIGAIAFSIVTVLIMRLSKQEWLKIAFPMFDIVLAFCGFNLSHAGNLLDNPIRFALSLFMSVFAGAITYSLGQINAQQHEVDSAETLNRELIKIKGDLSVSQISLHECEQEVDLLETDLLETKGKLKVTLENELLLQSNLSKLQTDFADTLNKLEVTQKSLNETLEKIAVYEPAYYAAERSRILKKAERNRTPEEILILERTN